MKNITIIAFLFLSFLNVHAQNHEISFTASGVSSTLDSVFVQNLTSCASITIDGTDVLNLVGSTGLSTSLKQESKGIFIYPNPMNQSCKVEFYNSQEGISSIKIYDFTARNVINDETKLREGAHSFIITGLKTGAYFIRINTTENIYTSQIISLESESYSVPEIKYESFNSNTNIKSNLKSSNAIIQMSYNTGDVILFEGFSGNYSSVLRTLTPIYAQQVVSFLFVDNAITGNNAVCQGDINVSYSVSNVSGITYTWTYSGTGLTIQSGQGSNTIITNFDASATAGNLIVTPSTTSCGDRTQQTLSINVTSPSDSPASVSIIASENNICPGTSVTFTATPTNGGTTPLYQWKVNDINVGMNSSTYTYSPAQGDEITCVMTSSASCVSGSPATSNNVTMLLNAGSVGGTAANDQTICSNYLPYPVTLTGNTGTIQWQSSTDNTSWSDISGATTETLSGAQMGTLTDTHYYRATVTNGSCTPANSNTVTVAIQSQTTAPTSITGTTTICSGNSAILTAIGGSEGLGCSYQWGSGTTVGLNILTGATSSTYITSVLTGNTTFWVRRISTTCTNTTSGITGMTTVQTPPTAPTSITGTTTICDGNSAILIASGGSEGLGCSYQWGSGTTVGQNILSSSTSSTYTTPVLTGNTTFWVRRINSTCSNTTSGVTKTVVVQASATAPTSITGSATICSGNNTILTAFGGSVGLGCTYQWGSGTTIGINIISGAISSTYTTPTLTSSTTFWARRISTSCANTTTGVTRTVTIQSSATAPTGIVGTATICSGNNTILTASGGSEGLGCTYQWGTGSTVGLNILSGAISSIYTTQSLTNSTTFWVRRISTSCSNTTTGFSISVTVEASATAPTSIAGTASVCSGSSTILTASGGSEGLGCIYQWGSGNTVGVNSITGTASTRSTGTLSATTYYWVRRISNTSCATTTSGVTRNITVHTAPTAPTGITGSTPFNSGSTQILTATGGSEGSGCTYQWGTGSTVGSNSISGTASTRSVTLYSDGYYWVRRIGNTACTNTTGGVYKLIDVR